MEKLLIPKPQRPSTVENKTPVEGAKWSFAVGTNLLSGLGAKVERESKQKLNEFARELRSFRNVDMSGMRAGYILVIVIEIVSVDDLVHKMRLLYLYMFEASENH